MPGKPATERVTFRINKQMLTYVDTARGAKTRAAYLRDLIRAEAKRRVVR